MSKTRCPECGSAMQVEVNSDQDMQCVTDQYWWCPECNHAESYQREQKTYWLIELPSESGPPEWFIGQHMGPLPSGRAQVMPFSPDANDAVAAGYRWSTKDDAEQARLRFLQCDFQDYYLLKHAIVTEHVFL